MGVGAAALVSLLLGLLDRTAAIAALLDKVHSEKRDVSKEELDALFLDDDKARRDLVADIARREAAGEK